MSGRGKKFLALGVAVVLCLAAAAAMGSLFHWKVTWYAGGVCRVIQEAFQSGPRILLHLRLPHYG